MSENSGKNTYEVRDVHGAMVTIKADHVITGRPLTFVNGDPGSPNEWEEVAEFDVITWWRKVEA